jgi:transcriptional regulator with XRE-family HTH domain
MNRVDFGKLVASLRKEHEDEDGAPWTQEKLAQEANLAADALLFNEDIVSSVERGIRNLDRQTLLAFATALQLTSNERKEFFLAASGIDTKEIARQDDHPEKIFSQFIDRVRELYAPAFLVDAYCNVLAVNYVLLELLEFPSAYGITPGIRYEQPYGYNLLRFFFSDDGSSHLQKIMGESFPDFAYHSVNIFRSFSLAYRSTKYFQGLLNELRKYHLFRRYWSETYFREDDRQFNRLINANINVTSQKWGPLSLFFTTRTEFTTAGDLHLGVFVPADQKTSSACEKVYQIGSPTVFNLTPWPNEDYLK